MNPPKPSALKLLEGDTRQRGANKHAEAIASIGDLPSGLPEKPEEMSEGASKQWDYLMRCAGAEMLFREADGALLAAFCEAYAGFQDAVKAKKWTQMDKMCGRMLNTSDRLGLSPSARARLTLGVKSGAADPMERALAS